jgi:L-serine deaminase
MFLCSMRGSPVVVQAVVEQTLAGGGEKMAPGAGAGAGAIPIQTRMQQLNERRAQREQQFYCAAREQAAAKRSA